MSVKESAPMPCPRDGCEGNLEPVADDSQYRFRCSDRNCSKRPAMRTTGLPRGCERQSTRRGTILRKTWRKSGGG